MMGLRSMIFFARPPLEQWRTPCPLKKINVRLKPQHLFRHRRGKVCRQIEGNGPKNYSFFVSAQNQEKILKILRHIASGSSKFFINEKFT